MLKRYLLFILYFLIIFGLFYIIWYIDSIEFYKKVTFLIPKTIISTNMVENDIEFNFDYDDIINKYKLNKTRLIALPYISGDTIKGLADHVILDENATGFQAEDVKCAQIIQIYHKFVDNFLIRYHSFIKNPYILITYSEDDSVINKWIKYLEDSKIIVWFAPHANINHPKLKPIPLGIANVHPTGQRPHADFNLIKKVSRDLKPFHERKTLLYLNFALQNNKEIRTAAAQYFLKNFGNDSSVYFVGQNIQAFQFTYKFEDYLKQIVDVQFIVSPPGFGIDCYRTWETLIVGAVPIVLRSAMQPLYDDMPVMVVDKWEEVTYATLWDFKAKLKLDSNGVPWRPKIWLRYWIEQIFRIRTKYEPFCSTNLFY